MAKVFAKDDGDDLDLRQFLAKELAAQRHTLETLEDEFMTFATIVNDPYNDVAQDSWRCLGNIFTDNLFKNLGDEGLAETLLKESNVVMADKALEERTRAVAALVDFRKFLSQSIKSTMPSGKNAPRLRIGWLGELLSYMFAKDIDRIDCLFHRLSPDSPNVSRPGIDLIGVKLGQNEDEDFVCIWEAKGTTDDVARARDDIIEWFNSLADSRINMAVESAKREWKKVCPAHVFRRASIALTKFAFGVLNFCYFASVIYEKALVPSDDVLRKFEGLKCKESSRNILLFPIENLQGMADEVFRIAWST